MNYRPLGKTGMEMSEIGFGAWAIGGSWGPQREEDSQAALHRALDLGVNFIDTAAGYGNGRSERIIAKVLAERKERVYVATKTPPATGPWPPSPYCRWQDRYGEQYIRQNVEERLRNLHTDCLDVLQLHTWTRAWNDDPKPLEILRKLRQEGKIRAIGISTPEHDQNCAIELMRGGWVDVVQVIYNLFEQEPAAQLLPAAKACGVGIIVRVALDEGSLTGKFTPQTRFAEGDFRSAYFAEDRLERTCRRVEQIKQALLPHGRSLPEAALRFVLDHSAVSTVIPGMRNAAQAEANAAVADAQPLPRELVEELHGFNWLRGLWYSGK